MASKTSWNQFVKEKQRLGYSRKAIKYIYSRRKARLATRKRATTRKTIRPKHKPINSSRLIVPKEVVDELYERLSEHIQTTRKEVKKAITKFLSSESGDVDRKTIEEEGWTHHTLTDSFVQQSILDLIESK
jgi:hypothetical protein